MGYLPNQYEDQSFLLEGRDREIAQLRARLKAIREQFLRYESPKCFSDERDAYQEMRKLILEEV